MVANMTEEEMRKWIDNASYEELLEKNRYAHVGSPWFQGEIGTYFIKTMQIKKEEIGPAAAVRASKNIDR